MECLTDHTTLTQWLLHYGSVVLFISLVLGIIALPIPEETLMILAGILMRQGDLHIPQTIIAALFGSICGISVSYLLGLTAGHYLMKKFGQYFGFTQEKLDNVHKWFEKYGKWTLFIGYFIPGVRHFTGFSAGMSELQFKQFALFAYLGALIWVSLFLSVGYFFGNFCLEKLAHFEIGLNEGLFFALLIVLGYFLFKHYKEV